MDEGPRLVGDVLDFRGILFAPVTPAEVKDLLITLLRDLQMRDVKCCPDGAGSVQRRVGEAWQQLQVLFAVHSQDVKDQIAARGPITLLICYAHDWVDCPVEVRALKPLTMMESFGAPPMPPAVLGATVTSAFAEPSDLDAYLARSSAATRHLFQQLDQGLCALSPEIRKTVTRGHRQQGGLSYASPERVFLFVNFQGGHGLSLTAFTHGQVWLGVKPLSAPRWGSLRVRTEDELARALEVATLSFGAIKAAIARGERTGMHGVRRRAQNRPGRSRGR